jgi:cytochrome c-type biogenesis protein
METVFLGGSLAAAFVAGTIALFAPCCILVVFPSYLSAAVRNQRWRLVPLTLVFAAGLSVVLVPAALGIGILTRSLLRFHGPVYVAGGLLLLGLAAVALSGKVWSLPMLRHSPDIQRTDSGGVFALGVFSGAASACCAPVLAGVLTLTAVSPGLFSTIAIAFAYVGGMVAPLLVLTLAWDRADPTARLSARGRTVTVGLGRWKRPVGLLDAVVAGMFAVMGFALIGLGATGTLITPTFQVGIGQTLRTWLDPVVAALESVPDPVIGGTLLAVAVGALWLSARPRRSDARATVTNEPVPGQPDAIATTEEAHEPPACH